uniref:Uncharacterized protein n=1 Tax=Cucumis melo TaxID=3656 RepID=A0A9I9E6P4_CUCME
MGWRSRLWGQINTFEEERLEYQSHRSHKYHTKSHQSNRFFEKYETSKSYK